MIPARTGSGSRGAGRASVVMLALVVAACGGGGGAGTADDTHTVSGIVSKGPLSGATVQLFNMDAAGNKTGSALSTAVTAANGQFSVSVPPGVDLLAETSGGSYVDESDTDASDGIRSVGMGSNGLRAVLAANSNLLVITPYTDALYRKAQLQANGNSFGAVYPAVVGRSTDIFGFDVTRTIPADPLNPSGSDDQLRYALLLGGSANAINSIAIGMGSQTGFAHINAFVEDLADGKLDGKQNSVAVRIPAGTGTPIPANISLNQEIARFRNNNSSLYQGAPAAAVDEAAFAQPAPVPNQPPVAVDDSATTNEDVAVTLNVLSNDTDFENDALTVIAVSTPAGTSATIGSGGNITFTPAANFNGSTSFGYTVSDGHGGTDTGAVSVTVNPVNDAPVAANDSYSVNEDTTLTVAAAGVLGNDSDVDGDTLTAQGVAGPASGTLNLASDGSFTYAPAPNFNGTVTFTYKAKDAALFSNIATVTITVNGVNDPPVLSGVPASPQTTNEDTALPPFTATFTDPDSTSFTLTGASDTQSVVQDSGIAITGSGASRTVTVTPKANAFGSATITLTLSDGAGGQDVKSFTLNVTSVNDPPVAGTDSYTATEDIVLNVAARGVLANDTDVEDPASALTADTVLVAAPAHGSVTLNANGSFSYTPAANYFGADSFQYKVKDTSGGSATGTVNLTVTAVNDPPTISAIASPPAFDEDTDSGNLTFTINDADPGDTLTLTGGSSNLTLVPVSGITFGGTNPNRTVKVTPAANQNGSANITVTVSDGNGGSASTVFTVTVKPVNDAPVAVGDSYNATEDQTLTVTAAGGVLANDTDIENDTLTASRVSTTSHGTLTLNGDGSFSYAPVANYNGPDSFTYQVQDNGAPPLTSNTVTVNLNVAAVNDPPTAVNDAATVTEDSSANSIDVLANDTDIDTGDTKTITAVGTASNGGTVTIAGAGPGNKLSYTPALNFNGTETFTCTMKDSGNATSSATVTVTVTPVNDAPVAVADSASVAEDSAGGVLVDVLANDSDVDSPTPTIIAVSTPSHGTAVIESGKIRYTPTELNFNGSDSFTYTIGDNGTPQLTATATVTITVTAVNDAPVAVNDAKTVDEDTSANAIDVLANDTDVDAGDTKTITGVGPTSKSGSVTIVGAGPNNTLGYTPAANFNGTETFSYTMQDAAGATSTATVTVTVNNVNDAPVAVNDGASVAEDTAGGVLIDVLANDTDVDAGDTKTVAAITQQPAHGTAVIESNKVRYTQTDANYNGTDVFAYTLQDNGTPQLTSNAATVTVTITPVNDAPVAANDPAVGNESFYTTNEDTTLMVLQPQGVLFNDTDVDLDTLAACTGLCPPSGPLAGPTRGTVSMNLDGSFTYTPDPNANGTDTFFYQAKDPSGAASTAQVTIQITPVPDAPQAFSDTAITSEDTPLDVAVLANDVDPDGDLATPAAVTLVVTVAAGHGDATPLASGKIRYVPAANFSGTDSFRYRITDDGSAAHLGSNEALVSITVNQPPLVFGTRIVNVIEKGAAAVTTAILNAIDDASSAAQIIFSVSPLPGGGEFRKSGTSVASFTLADVQAPNVAYADLPADTRFGEMLNMQAADSSNAVRAFTFEIRVQPENFIVSTSGATQGNAASGGGALGADGTTAVFVSAATNFQPAPATSPAQVYRKNFAGGTLDLVSKAADTVQNNPPLPPVTVPGATGDGVSSEAAVSRDGRFVAFASASTNLGPTNNPAQVQIYRKDMTTGAVVVVSQASAGVGANGASSAPVISDDGTVVAFASAATNLSVNTGAGNLAPGGTAVYVADLGAGTLKRIGTRAGLPSLSATGRYVAFHSTDQLVSGQDTNTAINDVYVHDRQTATWRLASAAGNEAQPASNASLSADGLKVAFFSSETTLTGATGGQFYLRDLVTGEVNRINADSVGNAGAISGTRVMLSGDARYAAFLSSAAIGAGNSGGATADLYVKAFDPLNLAIGGNNTGAIRRLNLGNSGTAIGGDVTGVPVLSKDGSQLLFESGATNITAGDANNVADVFRRANPLWVP